MWEVIKYLAPTKAARPPPALSSASSDGVEEVPQTWM